MQTLVILASLFSLPAIAPALDFPDELLAAHNEERALTGLPALRWDAMLAADAKRWALHLSTLGELVHDPKAIQGENLSKGPANANSLRDFVSGWTGEKTMWRNGQFPDVVKEEARAKGIAWQDVGHYSQVVWRTTTHVGCATATAKGWDYLVCRYSPPGNLRGQKAF
jgi:hypothetical protein